MIFTSKILALATQGNSVIFILKTLLILLPELFLQMTAS